MKLHLLAALLAASALAACGFDSTPQSSGSTAATQPAEQPAAAEKAAEGEKPAEGEKKAD
jgi:uncharacterized low-complexity protein